MTVKVRGYPELTLRADVMDTTDGLSQISDIRESRRIVGRGRVMEQDIVDDKQPGPRATLSQIPSASVSTWSTYTPAAANERGRMRMPRPFQIPMATLLPPRRPNFLPASKNIGVTHLTNGAFRLHPVEWNIGESAAMIASLWLEHGARRPTEVADGASRSGVPFVWFDDVGPDHPAFAAIQVAAIRGIYPLDAAGLHASPDNAPLTRAEAAVALTGFFGEHLRPEPLSRKSENADGWRPTIATGFTPTCPSTGRTGGKLLLETALLRCVRHALVLFAG